jgi:hypothetical protein
MGTMWPRVARLSGAIAALFVAAAPVGAQPGQQQQDPYPATLQFGTGLINIPVAWVSPVSGDVWVQTSGKTIPSFPDQDKIGLATRFNTNISMDTHWMNRFSVGVSAYSQNPEWGFFGQVLLLRDDPLGFLPGVALGARNVGPYDCEERLLIGHDIGLQADSTYDQFCGYEGFNTSPTLYGVATKSVGFGRAAGGIPSTQMSFSVGYGNGLFSDDGDLGDDYNLKGTIASGLFLGTSATFHPSLNSTLHVMVENDGWDWNAGGVFDYRGITVGIYGTELEEGSRDEAEGKPGRLIWNYRKLNLSLGYSGNIFDVARGVILRTRITDLTREQQRLRYEIAARERRIQGLEVALRRAQAGELAEMDRRRQELEQELNEEREQIRRANERLREIEQGRTPGTTPSAPPSTPPSTTTPPAGSSTSPDGASSATTTPGQTISPSL